MRGALVIGVGRPDRGDDGVGLEVARVLRARSPRGVAVLEQDGDATRLLESWAGAERIVVVDAASGGGPPGRVHRFEAHREALPATLLHASTHSWGVAEAVEMARALGRLPRAVIVYGIEGRDFTAGRARLSPPVAAAVEGVADRVLEDVSCRSPASGEGADGRPP